MRRVAIALVLLVPACEGLFGVDFDDVARRVTDAGAALPDASPGDVDGGNTCAGRPVVVDDPSTGCAATTCEPCPNAEHGVAVCEMSACAIACDDGYRRCTAGCCPLTPRPLAVGGRHTCATARSGSLYCWGENAGGQLGDRSRDDRLVPSAVFGLEGSTDTLAAAVDFTVMTGAGAVRSWGANTLGSLGSGGADPRDVPGPVAKLTTDARSVVAAGYHACAITRTGRAWCWGYGPSGVLGTGDGKTALLEPAPVTQPEPFDAIATGLAHACAIGTSGALYCWGANDAGQLALTVESVAVPTRVDRAGEVVAVTTGDAHTCVIARDGVVRCWGSNASAELGVGDTDPRSSVVDVIPSSEQIQRLTAGGRATCATSASGTVQCWGKRWTRATPGLGEPELTTRPAAFDVGGPVAFVSAGTNHVCARLLDGRVRCWGTNASGELGDGTRETRATPVDALLPE